MSMTFEDEVNDEHDQEMLVNKWYVLVMKL